MFIHDEACVTSMVWVRGHPEASMTIVHKQLRQKEMFHVI